MSSLKLSESRFWAFGVSAFVEGFRDFKLQGRVAILGSQIPNCRQPVVGVVG